MPGAELYHEGYIDGLKEAIRILGNIIKEEEIDEHGI